MEYQLVLQFPASDIDDFDRLISLEDRLYKALSKSHTVDGHDFGSGEMNIFVMTPSPQEAFGEVKGLLSADRLQEMKAAFREVGSDDFQLLWPQGARGSFSIV